MTHPTDDSPEVTTYRAVQAAHEAARAAVESYRVECRGQELPRFGKVDLKQERLELAELEARADLEAAKIEFYRRAPDVAELRSLLVDELQAAATVLAKCEEATPVEPSTNWPPTRDGVRCAVAAAEVRAEAQRQQREAKAETIAHLGMVRLALGQAGDMLVAQRLAAKLPPQGCRAWPASLAFTPTDAAGCEHAIELVIAGSAMVAHNPTPVENDIVERRKRLDAILAHPERHDFYGERPPKSTTPPSPTKSERRPLRAMPLPHRSVG